MAGWRARWVRPRVLYRRHRETIEKSATILRFVSYLYLLRNYVVDVTQVIGPSMLPTFHTSGDVVVLDHLTQHLGRTHKVGDVVIAKSPSNPRSKVCKRIIALEGDTVSVVGRFNAARNSTIVVGAVIAAWYQLAHRFPLDTFGSKVSPSKMTHVIMV